MTEQLITEIQRKMLPYLNNEQLMHLRDAMAETLEGATITYDSGSIPAEETDAVEAFITAKRIEGCSEKTLSYYRKTIESLIAGVGKAVQQVATDDLRRYLTNYQVQRRSSKVTIDNIRRILSSFFSWLEDEDFIGEPFEEKMGRLTSELSELFAKSHELEAQIKERLGAIGYDI
jgi:site-specific recombinase XerC